MDDSHALVAALKDCARVVYSAEVKAAACDREAETAQDVLIKARDKYRAALDALRTQLTLEVMGELSDAEFMQAKEVPRA